MSDFIWATPEPRGEVKPAFGANELCLVGEKPTEWVESDCAVSGSDMQ